MIEAVLQSLKPLPLRPQLLLGPENLAAAVALHVAHDNFVRVHGSLKVTPAMAAGVIDELWTIEDLYDAVME